MVALLQGSAKKANIIWSLDTKDNKSAKLIYTKGPQGDSLSSELSRVMETKVWLQLGCKIVRASCRKGTASSGIARGNRGNSLGH